MCEGHQLDLALQRPGQGLQVEESIVGHADVDQLSPDLLGEHLPGHQVAVVLHFGDDDAVAWPHVGPAPRVGHQIDGLRGVAGEDYAVAVWRVDERGDLVSRGFVGGGRLLAQRVYAPVDVGVVGAVELVHCLDHRPRFLGRGGVVQVGQWLAVDFAGQRREVGPHDERVKLCGGRHASPPRRRLVHTAIPTMDNNVNPVMASPIFGSGGE